MSPRARLTIAVLGIVGWAGLIWLGVRLFTTTPPTAGFDLELLLQAGRDVAAGRSPYDPAMLAGTAPVAERLFYSYPPVVAQLMALVAAVPSPVIFAAWVALGVAGWATVAAALTRRLAPSSRWTPGEVGWSAVALTPLLFPFAIGLLFGNLDVFFPLLYGLLLLGVLPLASRTSSAVGGTAAAVAGVTKLHPGSLGLWLLLRAVGSPEARRAVAAAIATGVAILTVSVVVGGTRPWADYATVVRAGSNADLVDPRNGGPAALLAMLVLGGGTDAEGMARSAQIAVTLIALVVTALAAWRLRDAVESLAWGATASLVILPVTWYHYPSALLPFALAALLRAQGTAAARSISTLLAAAAVIAAVAIAWLPLLWVAIGLVLGAVHLTGRTASEAATGRAAVDASPTINVA
jgi:hypothetical protein